MVGKTVGKYRIVETLGRGGMGVVYKAIDETLDREVAIKVFSADLDEQDVVNRFRTEATTLAKLNHPEIATIYELYRSESDLLMVMEYVRGETLEKLAQRSGPLPPERAAYLVAQVLGALDYAHRSGIVHRDLKPANVMINDEGHVKVMDFGIARVLGAAHTTLDGYMMGTPAYMAPEQVLGQEVDPRADLYSIGVVFYRLLTGALPFRSDTVIGMVQKQVSDPPTPARVHRANLPDWCEVVLARALAKNPADRFQTAEEFRQALLDPLNAVVSERTLPLRSGSLQRPAPTVPAATAPPTTASPPTSAAPSATKPPVTGAEAVTPAETLSVSAVTAMFKDKRVAAGGAVAGLLAVALIGFLMFRRGAPTPVEPAPASAGVVTLPTSPGAQSAASTQVSVPSGKPAGGAYELRRPAAPEAAPAKPAPPPALTARSVAPPSSAPAGIGRAANAAPFAFEAKAFVKEGDKEREHDAKVLLSDGVVTVTVRLDRTSEAVLSTIPFGSVQSVSYSKSKQPLWTTPSGPKQVFRLDVALGFFKGDRHWLSLRTNDAFIVLRIDGDDVNSVLAALEERTGRAVERLVDRKDNK
jgi:serine/threonine-protein kinase